MGCWAPKQYVSGNIRVFQVDDRKRKATKILDERFSTRKELRKLIFYLSKKAVIVEVLFDDVLKRSLFTMEDRYVLRQIENDLLTVESEY